MLMFYSLGRSQYDVLPGHNDSAHGRQHYRHDEVRQNIEGGQCLGGMANGLAWRLVEKRHHGGSLCTFVDLILPGKARTICQISLEPVDSAYASRLSH